MQTYKQYSFQSDHLIIASVSFIQVKATNKLFHCIFKVKKKCFLCLENQNKLSYTSKIYYRKRQNYRSEDNMKGQIAFFLSEIVYF